MQHIAKIRQYYEFTKTNTLFFKKETFLLILTS